jgi:hypothetical protein
LLIRMRSQVQVLAGPPAIGAGQSPVGSKPGTLAGCLGRAGAVRPSPPASPSVSPGPSTRATGATTTTHRGRPPVPRTAAPAAGAASSRVFAPPSATGAPHAPWPAREASVKRDRRPPPTYLGLPPTAPPTMGDLGASPASRPARPSTRAARRRGSPPGPGPVPVMRVPCRLGLSPNATA